MYLQFLPSTYDRYDICKKDEETARNEVLIHI